jgi:chemotaxis methyl-accepting protein methylase
LSSIAVESAREARFRHIVFRSRHGRAPVNLTPRPLSPIDAAVGNNADRAEKPLPHEDAAFVHWLFDRVSLDAKVYRSETLRRRLPACLRSLRARSIAQARQRLETDPGLTAAALAAMLIGVSEFFRDSDVFEYIRSHVLPALPRRAGHPRVWSVGCSDGQELYSVAMLLDEQRLLQGATLLGTDCRPAAVARAREARYVKASLHGVPARFTRKYFVQDSDGPQWRVSDDLRAAIQWRSGDATRVSEPGAWDMILCRNVSMYLRTDAARRLREICEQSLRVGGVLVFGKAERPQGSMRLTLVAPCVYRKE